jgi:AraC-like DNA-binding protein
VSSAEPVTDAASRLPAPPLRPLVDRYVGYRYLGFPPGLHRGLPTTSLTLVIALGPPTRLTLMPDGSRVPGQFRSLASGLGTRAVHIEHDGNQYGVQLDLTPLGARLLLGLPAGELGGRVVELPAVIGREAAHLPDRLGSAPDWSARFAILDEVLLHRLARASGEPGRRVTAEPLRRAWADLTDSGGRLRVDELAARAGWSRRHFTERFTREFGLGPKEVARIVRFQRSTLLLRQGTFRTLADVAVRSGFYDQAHLAREWSALAGCPPSVWLASEDLPSVQDTAGDMHEALVP